MKQRKSDIPPEASERLIREYEKKGPYTYFRLTECVIKGQVVGQRLYARDGKLMMETPLKNGKKHGHEYTWDEQGALLSMEPYVEGQLHGLAKQYGQNAQVIGTYRCVHGTGFDIWRHESEDGSISISEIHSLQDSLPHGYEWWLDAKNQHAVWHECHWQEGRYHGIERRWNNKGKLQRGYPKYWIRGQGVSKRVYVRTAQKDKTLPAFREKDNLPGRRFPVEIENLLSA